MRCIKEKQNDLYGLNCNMCSKYKDDEVVLIGKQVIKIYPIFKGCIFKTYDIANECFSERLARMLKEIEDYFQNNEDYVFLWSSDGKSEFIYNLGLLEAFIDQGLNFCIIYWNF